MIRIAKWGAAATVLILAGTGAFTGPASAEMMKLEASLSGANEVPSIDVPGAGAAELTFDTSNRQLTWSVTFSGLSGPATAAHFHGPADTTGNAPVVVPIGGAITSPATGSATLTEAQAADLLAGRWYINIHTAAHKPGEIRGQVTK